MPVLKHWKKLFEPPQHWKPFSEQFYEMIINGYLVALQEKPKNTLFFISECYPEEASTFLDTLEKKSTGPFFTRKHRTLY